MMEKVETTGDVLSQLVDIHLSRTWDTSSRLFFPHKHALSITLVNTHTAVKPKTIVLHVREVGDGSLWRLQVHVCVCVSGCLSALSPLYYTVGFLLTSKERHKKKKITVKQNVRDTLDELLTSSTHPHPAHTCTHSCSLSQLSLSPIFFSISTTTPPSLTPRSLSSPLFSLFPLSHCLWPRHQYKS